MLQQKAGVSAPWWVQLIVVAGAFLSAAGATIALTRPTMLVGPNAEIGAVAHIFAGYFAARSLTMAVVLLFLLALRALRALGQILALVGLIQLVDAIMDIAEGRWTIIPGFLILGALFLLAAPRLCGQPFWRRRAWLL